MMDSVTSSTPPLPASLGAPADYPDLHSPTFSPPTSPRAVSLATWMVEEGDEKDIPSSPRTLSTSSSFSNLDDSQPIDNIPRSSRDNADLTLPPEDTDSVGAAGSGARWRTNSASSSVHGAPSDEESTNENKRQTLNTSSWKRSVIINAPHILLETINARTAGVIIVATYLCFIVSFIIDFNTTYKSFNGNNNNFQLGSRLCTATNYTLAGSAGPWGCWKDSKTWHGSVDNLSNVLLVTLGISRNNFTLADTLNSTADPYIYYNVNLYACYLEQGCGNRFETHVSTTNADADADVIKPDTSWQSVLSTGGFSKSLLTTSDLQLSRDHQPLEGTFFSVFQNQESLPTNGLVKSYYAQVSFLYEQSFLIGSATTLQPTVFVVSIASRPPSLGYNVATILLFIFTVLILSAYLLFMRRKAWPEWLQEQKWLVAYLVCLLFYQNPIYIIVNFHATSGGAFVAYFFSDLAQACLLVVWLLFADSVNSQENTVWGFYFPKIVAGATIFLTNLVILSFQFPSFSPESGRTPVESVYNWNSADKLLFIAASMCFLLLFWIWALVWFATIYLSQQKLDTLSYMSTRYLQLSFRYFILQATLVTVYYILQYAATIYFIGVNQPFKQNVTTLTDNVNVLFRQQTQLFGKTLFLTIYGAILAFLFLPSDFLRNDLAASLAATYAVSLREQEVLVRKRKKVLRKQSILMNQVTSVNPHIFCVDLALSLLEIAYEAYNESDAGNQRHGFLVRERVIAGNLLPYGYTLVEIIEDKALDILCLVARHTEAKRLVFAFRGTRSTKNMGNNLDYSQKDVDVSTLPVPEKANTAYITSALSQSASTLGTPASPISDFEDAESDDSSNDDSTDDADRGRKTDTNVFEMAFHIMAATLKVATTNALHVGGELVMTAASVTPGLNQFLRTSVHSGFWKAYESMRGDVHRIIYKEFKNSTYHLCFTGHSLGGALATLACMDTQSNIIPRINQYWRHKRQSMVAAGIESATTGTTTNGHDKVKVTMYNFGCPRVGNRQFASEYNQLCPDSFRVVVDGDFITSIPKTGFVHVGTEVVIDSKSAGSIIVDPSFVEQWLRSKVKTSLRVHLMAYYRNGMEAVKKATEFLRQHIKEGDRRASNIIRLAIQASPRGREARETRSEGGVEMTENPLSHRSSILLEEGASPLGSTATTPPSRLIIRQSINLNALQQQPRRRSVSAAAATASLTTPSPLDEQTTWGTRLPNNAEGDIYVEYTGSARL